MKMYKLSPSTINLMLECPRCFWLHIVRKIKRPQMVFPSITNGMDRVLKEHFDRFMERGEIPPEIRGFNPILVLFEFKDSRRVESCLGYFNPILVLFE